MKNSKFNKDILMFYLIFINLFKGECMKKSQKITLISLLIITVFFIIGIKFIPFGTVKYKNEKMVSTLIIPKLSSFDYECCMFSANFKSFRSQYILKKELAKIMDNYEKKTCDSKTYYYDLENDITITEYGVQGGFPMNKFYIVYDKGEYSCDNDNLVSDIIDKSIYIDDFICNDVLDSFYEDELYQYSYPCIKSSYVVVKYKNGIEEPVKEALKKGKITINDLDKHNIRYSKIEKSDSDFTKIVINAKEMKISKNDYNTLKEIFSRVNYNLDTNDYKARYIVELDGNTYDFYRSNNMVGYNGKFAEIDGDNLVNVSNILDFIFSNNDMDNIENVSMKIKDGTLTKTGATVIITDTNKEHYDYGLPFRLDKKENGIWQMLEVTGDGNFILPAYGVDKNNRLELNQSWDHIYGELKNGEYRLVKAVCISEDCNEQKYFSVEFILE